MMRPLLSSVVASAYRTFWRERDHFLYLALIPAILLMVLSLPLGALMRDLLGFNEAARENVVMAQAPRLMLLSICYFLVLSFYAANWLRFLAFGIAKQGLFGLNLGKGHFLFAVAAIGVLIFQTLILDVLFLSLGRILPVLLIVGIGFAIGLYVILRLSPFFVGLALERAIKIKQSLSLTKTRTGLFFLGVIGVQLPIFFLEYLIGMGLNASSLMDAAPYASGFILAMLELARLSLTLIVLFLFYRKLTELEVVA